MRRPIKRIGDGSIDIKYEVKKYDLLETGLFSEIDADFLNPNLKLIGTDYVLFTSTIAKFTKWLYGPAQRIVTLEEIFDNVPPDIGEKMAFHLNILPK